MQITPVLLTHQIAFRVKFHLKYTLNPLLWATIFHRVHLFPGTMAFSLLPGSLFLLSWRPFWTWRAFSLSLCLSVSLSTYTSISCPLSLFSFLPVSTIWGYKKSAAYNSKKALTKTQTWWHHILAHLTSRNGENKCLLCKSPSLLYFIMGAQTELDNQYTLSAQDGACNLVDIQ